MFDNFGEYMFSLLFGPIRRGRKSANQFYIFFSVLGKRFDQVKDALFKMRAESLISCCSVDTLSLYGKERDMPQMDGEDADNYRARLMLKNEIAELAGTTTGILLALETIGYYSVYIEPFYLYDSNRWAEFIVYLGTNAAGVVTDVDRIDREVSKVKPASARANYFSDHASEVEVGSEYTSVNLCYMMCGLQQCGGPIQVY